MRSSRAADAGIGLRAARRRQQQRQRGDAGAQVGAGHLAGLLGLRRQVDDVVDELERHADLLAELDDGLLERVGSASEKMMPDLRGGGDERAGLVGEHLDVVRDRVVAVARADGLVQLAEARAARRCRPAGGWRARRGRAMSWLARANSRSPVRIATELPHTVCALGTPRRMLGLVHDVVVVERGEVGDLDRLRPP